MKKELKPKNGWRKSLIFSLRGKFAEPKSVDFAQRNEAEERLSSLSAFERSWYYRAPLSSQFAEEVMQNKPRSKQKASTVLKPRNVGSRLPAIPVRRSTLIDIIKSKRVLVEILSQPAGYSA